MHRLHIAPASCWRPLECGGLAAAFTVEKFHDQPNERGIVKTTLSKPKPKKVVLAYSGGLDTSIIIPWLKENYQCEVIAGCGDAGQGREELSCPEAKSRASRASECLASDLREQFATGFL